MKLYVMRHGQTDWNVKKKIQGCTDIEFVQTGDITYSLDLETENYTMDTWSIA